MPIFKRRNTITAIAVSAALALAPIVSTTTAATALPAALEASAAECAPVVIVAFRGSGQKNLSASSATLLGKAHKYGTSNLTTNGWEGATLEKLFSSYVKAPNAGWPNGFSPDNVPVIGIGYDGKSGYPAIPAEFDLNIFDNLVRSSSAGANHAVTVANEWKAKQPAGCKTKFIATGYSQGAMAARYFANAMPSDVVGVVDFGDPFQKPNAPGNEGVATHGEGIVRWWIRDAGGQALVDKFYDLSMHKTALCHDHDPMCSYDALLGPVALKSNIGPHLNYFDINDEARTKGKELADLAAKFSKVDAEPPAVRKALDTVFVIDTTGSMQPYIDSAKETAAQAAAKILNSANDGRVGLVEYRDHGDEFVARQVVPLTGYGDAFTAGLDSLNADGGGDWPEAVSSGIIEGMRAGWNAEASKSIVVIGDAPGHDPEPVTGYTFQQVSEILAGREPVPAPSIERRSSRDAPTDREQDPGEASTGGTDAAVVAASSLSAAPSVSPSASGTSVYVISADPDLTQQAEALVSASGGAVFPISDPSQVADLLLESVDDLTTAPEAVINVAGTQLTTMPLTVNAGESSTHSGAATYDYDLDGDGTFELLNAGPNVVTQYAAAGTYNVSVRVSDDRARTSVATWSILILDLETATRDLPDPTNTSTALTGASLSSPVTTQSKPSKLTVTDPMETGEALSARLVPAVDGDPWATEAVAGYGDVAGEPGALTITVSPGLLPAGAYRLLVSTDEGRHAVLDLSVGSDGISSDPAAGAGPITGSPASPTLGTPGGTAAAPSKRFGLPQTGGDAQLLAGLAALLLSAGGLLAFRRRALAG